MKILQLLQSEKAAWILGAAVVGAICLVAFWVVGWLGIGIFGLIGLVVSNRIDLQSGHGVLDSGLDGSAVSLYARQREAQSLESLPERKMAAAAEAEKRSRTLYRVNTGFIALTVLGIGMFALHQLT